MTRSIQEGFLLDSKFVGSEISWESSREWYVLYVKCVCLLSRYLSPVVENGMCYMLNVCVCCLVISAQ